MWNWKLFCKRFTKTRVPSNSPWKGAKWTNWIACEKNELPRTLPKKGLSQEKMIEIGYWNWLTQRSKLEIGKLIVWKLDDPEVEIGWPNSRNWELVDQKVEIVWPKGRKWELSDPKVGIGWPSGQNWKLMTRRSKLAIWVTRRSNVWNWTTWRSKLEIEWPEGRNWEFGNWNWELEFEIGNWVTQGSRLENWMIRRFELKIGGQNIKFEQLTDPEDRNDLD